MTQGNIRVENFRQKGSDIDDLGSPTASPGAVAPGFSDKYKKSDINKQAVEATLEKTSLDTTRKSELAAEISVELAKIDDDEISDRRAFARGYLARAEQRESAGVQESVDTSGPAFEPDSSATEERQPAGDRGVTGTRVETTYSDDVVFPVFHNAVDLDESDPLLREPSEPESTRSTSETKQGQETSTDETDTEAPIGQMNQRVDRIQSISAALSTVILVAAIGLSLGFGFGVFTLTNPAMMFAAPALALIGVALVYIEARAEQRVT